MANTNSNIQLAIMKLAVLNSWLKQRKCYLMIIGSFLLIVVFSGLIILHSKHKDNPNNKSSEKNIIQSGDTVLPAQLNAIQDKLSIIEHELNLQNNKMDVATLAQQFTTENQQLMNLNEKNTLQIITALSSQIREVQLQLSALSQSIILLRHASDSTVYMDKKALPFTVIAIDNIQQQPVVTVIYNYKNIPLVTGYSIAGWQLIASDYSPQQAEFINSHQQHVKITLSNHKDATKGVGYA